MSSPVGNFIATVSQIDNCDSLHLVKFECNGEILSMMSLDLSDDITIGTRVKLLIKPTHVAIAKNFSGKVSYSNKLETTIASVENGQLLSSIKLKFYDALIESIITLNSSQMMELKVGDKVTAFIKASELSIGEVLND